MLTGLEIDAYFNWPLGTARRLAKRGRIPYKILPDGSFRFELEQIIKLIRHVPLSDSKAKTPTGGPRHV